jgi:hypothetical protein
MLDMAPRGAAGRDACCVDHSPAGFPENAVHGEKRRNIFLAIGRGYGIIHFCVFLGL